MLESVTKEQLALALYIVSSRLNSVKTQLVPLVGGVGAWTRSQQEILEHAFKQEIEYPEYCLEAIQEVVKELKNA